MAREILFFDNFANSAVDLPTDEGNGSVSESGSEITLSIGGAVNGDWTISTFNAPVAYAPLSPAGEPDAVTSVEARFSGLTVGGTNGLGGLAVFTADRRSFYQMFWREDLDRIDLERMVDNASHVNLAFTGALSSPSAADHIYRVVWDREQDYIGFHYSVDAGVTWTALYAERAQFRPERGGVYARNFGALHSVDADFEYLQVSEETGQQPADYAGVEDSLALEDAGGTVQHQSGTGTGLRVPGSSGQPLGNTEATSGLGPFDTGGFEDSATVNQSSHVSVPGPPSQPSQNDGLGPSDRGSLEEVLEFSTDNADYMQELDDSDGVELLGGTNIQDVVVYDATQDPWHDPTGHADYYGIGRDGYFYYAGVACGYGDFGTLAGGVRQTSWGSDEEPLALWSNVSGSITMIADDKVRLSGTFNNYEGKALISRYRWLLDGDFDIHVNFEALSIAGGSDGGVLLQAQIDGNNYIYVRRNDIGGGRYDSDVNNDGGFGNYVSVGTSDTSGRLRLVRSGTSVSSYYWSGSSWTLLRSGISMAAGAQPMHVDVMVSGTGVRTISADVFGFGVVSGTVITSAGWRRESSGTHRGARKDFPERSVIVSTAASVDIIDADTDKLWMRFLRGASNAIPFTIARPHRLGARNGMLVVSNGSPSTETDDGGCSLVDFTLDNVQFHLVAGSGVTGGLLRTSSNGTQLSPTGQSPRDVVAHGIIRSRNSGFGIFNDFDQWQIPGARAWDTDMLDDADGYQFRAHATFSGIGAHKWKRWFMDGARGLFLPGYGASTETAEMRWVRMDGYGDLFYLSTSAFYSAEASTWQTALSQSGGSWSADSSESLPGTRSWDSQYAAVLDGYTDVYVPANEGVYLHDDWPNNSFALLYGPAGSGAAFEILPDGIVTTLSLAQDGAEGVLLVGLRSEGPSEEASQIVGVRLSDDTVYGKSEISRLLLNASEVMGV